MLSMDGMVGLSRRCSEERPLLVTRTMHVEVSLEPGHIR